MKRGDNKRAKKTTGGAGGQPPPSGGQLVTLTGGLSREVGRRALTAAEFQGLSAVPLEAEWFANIDNPRTRRAYRIDIHEFMAFMGIGQPEEFRKATRAHVLAWRKDLETRELGGATIWRKLPPALQGLPGRFTATRKRNWIVPRSRAVSGDRAARVRVVVTCR
jgi:hypothetical protein